MIVLAIWLVVDIVVINHIKRIKCKTITCNYVWQVTAINSELITKKFQYNTEWIKWSTMMESKGVKEDHVTEHVKSFSPTS